MRTVSSAGSAASLLVHSASTHAGNAAARLARFGCLPEAPGTVEVADRWLEAAPGRPHCHRTRQGNSCAPACHLGGRSVQAAPHLFAPATTADSRHCPVFAGRSIASHT